MSILDELDKYLDQIQYPEDKLLLEEALKASKSGALRAAYIMIWLACVESLKRRFKEIAKYDNTANEIIGQIKEKEDKHHSVDEFILRKARDYGFLSESEYGQLDSIYKMRCIYGHPYEEKPYEEEIVSAACLVTGYVLSKPTKLRYGFCDRLLNTLLNDSKCLDDYANSVKEFARLVIPKIDDKIYSWFLEKYWAKLENIASDITFDITFEKIFKRGVWFSQECLEIIGTDIYDSSEWHVKVSTFPESFIHIFSDHLLYSKIGGLAQDSLIGHMLDRSKNLPRILWIIEQLFQQGVLTERQKERFIEHVKIVDINNLYASGIKLIFCYERVISELKSHDWYRQNPTIYFISQKGPIEIRELSPEQQTTLGRNILQCADGNAKSAIYMIDHLLNTANQWPVDFIKGLFSECFVNEKNQIRFKEKYLSKILDILDNYDSNSRAIILEELIESINHGTFAGSKYWEERDIDQVITKLSKYDWTSKLCQILESKKQLLQETDS